MPIEPGQLEIALRRRFHAPIGQARVVVRQAVDLDDSGRYERDFDHPLENDIVLEELSEAPHGSLIDRWNWWIGSLEAAHRDYAEFGVQRYRK